LFALRISLSYYYKVNTNGSACGENYFNKKAGLEARLLFKLGSINLYNLIPTSTNIEWFMPPYE